MWKAWLDGISWKLLIKQVFQKELALKTWGMAFFFQSINWEYIGLGGGIVFHTA